MLAHFSAPPSWRLPVNLGLVVEFSFQPEAYAENSRTIELRSIVEEHMGRLELDAIPSSLVRSSGYRRQGGLVLRAFGPHGMGIVEVVYTEAGILQLVGCNRQSALGSRPDTSDVPGVDIKLGDHLTRNFSVGFGLTPKGSALIIKARFEVPFGKAHPRK